MLCPTCQTDNSPDSNYCRHCGYHFSLSCPRCRAVLLPDANFCTRCGFQLHAAPNIQTAPAALPQITQPALVQAAVEVPAARKPSARDTFEQFMPRELVEKFHAARQRGDTVGERRVVTILFCDVKGSTAAAEQLDPEDWTDIMNGAFESMIKPVYQYEGVVARLMGDAILAFFGAPITHEDDAERGVMAGLGILNASRPYRAQVAERYGIDFDVRIGINTGLVVVGAVGSDLRMEYTAMGDAINVAARMEQTATPGTLQIADATYRLVAPLFTVEALDGIEVKGKAEPVKAYRVLSRSAVRDAQRGIPGLEAPLIGRDRELALLKGVLDDAARGVGRIVCLQGEAGSGKSRLLRTISPGWETLSAGGFWFTASSISYEAQRAYSLIQNLIRELLNIPVGESGSALRDRLINSISSADADTRRARALLALFGLGDSADASLEGDVFRHEIAETIRGLIMARARPSVILFNDFHWADASSVDLLKSLLALIDELPLVLIFALRPERSAPAWQIKARADADYSHRYVEVALPPLTDDQSAVMIAALLGGAALPAPLVARMVERAGGNPFYLEEVVRSLIEAGVVVREQQIDGDEVTVGWRATRDSATFAIPDSLQALLNARIDRLEEEARSTLQLASVIGRTFYRRVLAAVDSIGQRLDASLTTLQQLDMIQEAARVPELEYRFRSPMTQEAVYQTILLKRRREFHLRVGACIEQLFPDRLDEMAPRLAYHFAEGRDFARALSYSRMAGDAAYRLFAHVEAIMHYTQALDAARQSNASIADLIYLYERRGRSLELANRFIEAEQNYNDMAAEGETRHAPALKLAALTASAPLYGTQTPLDNPARAVEISQQALELARSLNDRSAEAKALSNLSMTEVWTGSDQRQAIVYAEQSLAISRESGQQEMAAYTLVNLAIGHANLNQMETALSYVMEARAAWQTLGNRAMEGDSYNMSTWMYASAGRFDDSLSDGAEGIRISQAIGNTWNQVITNIDLSTIYLERGAFEQALGCAQTALRLATGANSAQVALCYTGLVYDYAELGERQQAEILLKLALEHWDEVPAALLKFSVSLIVEAYLLLGQTDAAAAFLPRSELDFDQLDRMNWLTANTYVARCHLLIAQTHYDAAREALAGMAEAMRQTNQQLPLPKTLILLHQALFALGDLDGAAQALAEAQAISEARGGRHLLWKVLAGQRDIAAARGDRAQAAQLGEQTRALLDSLAAGFESADLRACFLARADVQAALAPGA